MPTEGPIGSGMVLDFFNANIVQNNLGGVGPMTGAEELRYQGVGQFQGNSIDLVVVATSAYDANSPTNNGKNSQFGLINLRNDRAASFRFCFQNGETNENVVLDSFSFVFHDFDNGKTAKERLRVRTACQESASGALPCLPICELAYTARAYTFLTRQRWAASQVTRRVKTSIRPWQRSSSFRR